MQNKTLVRSLMSLAAMMAVALPASAQTVHPPRGQGQISNVSEQVYLRNDTTATITYFDNDPMASSRQLGRAQQVTLSAGGKGEIRRALRAVAPRSARWARVRTPRGRVFVINLHPTRNIHR